MIHVHSEYSVLDGAARIAENVERAVELGLPAIGLTDHGTVAGHLELDKECRKAGLKPVFGCEFYHGTKTEFGKNERDQSHFVAFALNDEGLKNLWRLADSAASNFRFVDRISWDGAESFSEGVGATSACMSGLVPKGLKNGDYGPLNRYLSIYRDNFWIEIHTYPGQEHEELNWLYYDVCRERGIPPIVATDAHYARPEQYQYYDMYIARQHGDSIYTSPEERKIWHPPGMYIQTWDEVRENLNYLPSDFVEEAIQNTLEIGERVDAHLPDVERHLPHFHVPDCPWKDQFDYTYGDDSEAILFELVEKGLKNRYGNPIPKHVWDRALMEMEAFFEAQIHHYFLLGWDTVQFCKSKGIIIGPGRGSSAGSVCAYALEITDVDPLPYELYFERFWNPGRAKGFPDIDSDFPRRSRKAVVSYLAERWGEDRVRHIGTNERMKPKDVIEKTGPSCGAYDTEVEQLKAIVENGVPDLEIHGPSEIGWSDETWPGKTIYVMHTTEGECTHGKDGVCPHCHVTGEKIIEWVESKPPNRQKVILRWLELIDFLCGHIGGKGVHASGVIVCDKDLPDETPCRWANAKDMKCPVTMFTMDDVEGRMMVKYDVLGLRTLDTLEEWKALVEKEDIRFEWSGLEWNNHPKAMWELLDDGFAAGIFQIERGFPKRLCQEYKPRSVEDLSVINALNRPGPIRSGAPASLLRRRSGEEPVTYDDTDDPNDPKNGWLLAEILEPTYGWFLYQEQVIKFFETIGYSKSDADAIRKILGKKKPVDMRAVGLGQGEWEGKGYREMAWQVGITHDAIQTIWERLEGFASYSFNKSHTVAYATVGFRTLFAKYNAPAEFYLACVRTVDPQKKKILVPRYVNEARRMGIGIKPPDILKSEADIDTIDGDIYYGFRNVKNVGASGPFIVKLREQYDVSTPELLTEARDRWNIDNDIDARREKAREAGKNMPQTAGQLLGSGKIDALVAAGAFDPHVERRITMSKLQEDEQEYLGVILTDNAADAYASNQDLLAECHAYEEVKDSVWDGEDLYFTVPGIITEVTPKESRKTGKPMGVIKIEYEGDEIDFVVRPDLWRSHGFLWKERQPGCFTLKRYEGGISFEKGQRLT